MPYTFWKRPWHKAVALAAPIVDVLMVVSLVSEYRNVVNADILSPDALVAYSLRMASQIAVWSLLAVLLAGLFIVGCIAKSERFARLAQGALMLLFAAAMLVAGAILGMFTKGLPGALLVICAAVGLAGGIASIRKGLRLPKSA